MLCAGPVFCRELRLLVRNHALCVVFSFKSIVNLNEPLKTLDNQKTSMSFHFQDICWILLCDGPMYRVFPSSLVRLSRIKFMPNRWAFEGTTVRKIRRCRGHDVGQHIAWRRDCQSRYRNQTRRSARLPREGGKSERILNWQGRGRARLIVLTGEVAGRWSAETARRQSY